jgi:hypothetical protein
MPTPRFRIRLLQLLVAVVAVLCAVILRTPWLIEDGWHVVAGWTAFLAYVAICRPAWYGRFLGDGGYDSPFWPFRRWTWETPPARWRAAVRNALLFGLLLFPGTAVWFFFRRRDHPQWGFIAAFILLSLWLILGSIRILARVRLVRAEHVAAKRVG